MDSNLKLVSAVNAMIKSNNATKGDIAYELGIFIEELELFLEAPDHPAIEIDAYLAECFLEKSFDILTSDSANQRQSTEPPSSFKDGYQGNSISI